MTEALQKVTREMKAMSADKYDVTQQGEEENSFSHVALKSLLTNLEARFFY